MHKTSTRSWNGRRLIADQGGSTAIEFAIVVGPFILIVGAMIEVGLMLFAEYTLQNAVQEAARQIQVGQMKTASASDFKTLVCDKAPILSNCATLLGIYVDNAPTFTALATAVPETLVVPPGNATPFNTGTGAKAVFVMATYDWKLTFPFMGMFNTVDGARRLQGTAVFMNEAFDS